MSDRFKKVQAGQSLEVSATAWNAFIDSAQKTKNEQHDERTNSRAQFRQADIIKIRNDSGINLARYSVLGISAPIFSPSTALSEFKNEVALVGLLPTEAAHFGRFAILLEPAMTDRIAKATVAGVCQVKVDVRDASHTCAEVDAGNTARLVSMRGGSAQMIWREGGLGEQWSIVRLNSTCGGGTGTDGGSRCDCPELPSFYAVNVACGPCGEAYGPYSTMPRWWKLVVRTAEENAYAYEPCADVVCSELVERVFWLENQSEPYSDEPSCVWYGTDHACWKAELRIEDETVTITITDVNDCVVATLTMDAADFECCGDNSAWIQDDDDTCNITALLSPDPCFCCPDETIVCPPPGKSVCKQLTSDCGCRGACDLTVTIAGLATIPPINPEDPIPPTEACGGMNGTYLVSWIGDCTWYVLGGSGGSDAPNCSLLVTYENLGGDHGEWFATLTGPSGQIAKFRTGQVQGSPCDTTAEWVCDEDVVMELIYATSTCPPTICPTATIGVVP